EREQHRLDRLPLADRDELHGVAIAARAGAGGADALLHAREVLRYPHGILSPAPARSCSVSVSGSPTTFEKLPSTRSTNAPASPCTAYAPALSSPSPDSTSQRRAASERSVKRTPVTTARDLTSPSVATQTPVITRCSAPDRRRSIRSASARSRGFSSTSSAQTTIVSAASATASPRPPRARQAASPAAAFSRASRSGYSSIRSPGRRASATRGTSTSKAIPRRSS